MWIIPKTLSAFVPDTEGLNLDLEERAWMLESSAMWRSKPSSKQTWLRRLKKDEWMTRLSTRILKPSQQKYFEEKYTDSLEDIPVSRSVARGSEKEKKIQGTYGHTSDSMYGQLDLFGASLKMSEATPRWGYGESCPIWKKMVTERSGDCSARRKQARLTNASESSSWPTVAASEARQGYQNRSRGKKGSQKSLTTIVVDNWSTPQARDWKGAQGRAYKGEAKDLPAQTEKLNWATPNTMDHLQAGISGSFKESLTGRRKRSSNLREQVNPNWPTASASDTEGGSQADRVEWTEKGATLRKKNKPRMTYGAKLRDAVENHENWPTPRAGNPGSRKPGTGGKILAEEAKIHNGLQDQEKSNTSGKNHGSWPTPRTQSFMAFRKGELEKQKTTVLEIEVQDPYPKNNEELRKAPKLNPNWVEQLMGLSTGWTDLGSWGMELSPKPQN